LNVEILEDFVHQLFYITFIFSESIDCTNCREGYSTVCKAIGIDTYRHIVGISRVQKSPGLRDIDKLSGGVCLPIQIRKDIDLTTKKYYSSLKKINKEAAIDCVQLDVIDQLSSEFGLGTLLGQMPNGDYDNC
jgi:hypothetical protein